MRLTRRERRHLRRLAGQFRRSNPRLARALAGGRLDYGSRWGWAAGMLAGIGIGELLIGVLDRRRGVVGSLVFVGLVLLPAVWYLSGRWSVRAARAWPDSIPPSRKTTRAASPTDSTAGRSGPTTPVVPGGQLQWCGITFRMATRPEKCAGLYLPCPRGRPGPGVGPANEASRSSRGPGATPPR